MKIPVISSVNTKFNLIFSALLLVLLVLLAFLNSFQEQQLIQQGAIDNARIISRHIIETRDYLSRNVKHEPEYNSALIPQVAASNIASSITKGTQYYLRQVSLKFRNPDNRPDPYEATKLRSFSAHTATESWEVIDFRGEKSLRYLLPVLAEESCLHCHGSYEKAPRFVQDRFPKGHPSYGYQTGEVIGAVSVAVPIESLYFQTRDNLKTDLLYDSIVLLFIAVIAGYTIRRTILNPIKKVADSISSAAHTGTFSTRLSVQGNDEISELEVSFNELMAELERKTIQKRESEERYRNFIEIAQSPIITFMADGRIVISNQKAGKLFGVAKDELLGQSIYDYLVSPDEIRQGLADYFQSGTSTMVGATSHQIVRDICGRHVDVEMVISVSQNDQESMFTAILRI